MLNRLIVGTYAGPVYSLTDVGVWSVQWTLIPKLL